MQLRCRACTSISGFAYLRELCLKDSRFSGASGNQRALWYADSAIMPQTPLMACRLTLAHTGCNNVFEQSMTSLQGFNSGLKLGLRFSLGVPSSWKLGIGVSKALACAWQKPRPNIDKDASKHQAPCCTHVLSTSNSDLERLLGLLIFYPIGMWTGLAALLAAATSDIQVLASRPGCARLHSTAVCHTCPLSL